jgi:hypothetical protein
MTTRELQHSNGLDGWSFLYVVRHFVHLSVDCNPEDVINDDCDSYEKGNANRILCKFRALFDQNEFSYSFHFSFLLLAGQHGEESGFSPGWWCYRLRYHVGAALVIFAAVPSFLSLIDAPSTL